MADGSTTTEPLTLRLAEDLQPKSPIELMRHARSLIPRVLECDDPAVLAATISRAGQIDDRLRSFDVAKRNRNAAAELKLWAMWRLGWWLVVANLQGGDHTMGNGQSHCGMDAILSSSGRGRCRQLAKLSREVLATRLEQIQADAECVCLASVLRSGAGEPAEVPPIDLARPQVTAKRRANTATESDLAVLTGHIAMMSQSLESVLDQARQSKRMRHRESSSRRQLSLQQLDIDMVEHYLREVQQELERLTSRDERT